MLRLALCGLVKTHQGSCWSAWQIHVAAAAALSAKHQRTPQHGSFPLSNHGSLQFQGANPAVVQQHLLYSQHSQPPKQQQAQQLEKQQPEQEPSSGSSNAGPACADPSSNSTSATRATSTPGSTAGGKPPADNASPASKPSSHGRKQYTGAITAAQLKDRRCPAAAAAQLDTAEKQQKPAVQQQWRHEQLQQVSITSTKRQREQPHANQLEQPEPWQQPSSQQQQQQQWQQAANYQKNPPQQQQYKIVQYSRGNSLLLALSSEPSGEYTLAKTKGPASAADLAAFGRTKPSKDGAAAAAKAAKEVPLLLRPFHSYYLHIKKVLQATFLPSGYPASVGSNYLQYTLWQVGMGGRAGGRVGEWDKAGKARYCSKVL